ncbi:TPA: 50S ribosomal protein L29 [Candidatus Gracilibacteria bacterium]|nr:50S ribosomal protein L29 [Candidatus Gracilibacteria bacterium]
MKKQLEKDIKALEALDASELAKEIAKTEKELFLLNMKNRANELKQSHTLGLLKKYLAKLHMVKARL